MALYNKPMERPMSYPFDASRFLTTLEQDSTIVAVIEMSQSKWLVSAVVPGIERQPLKKLDRRRGAAEAPKSKRKPHCGQPSVDGRPTFQVPQATVPAAAAAMARPCA